MTPKIHMERVETDLFKRKMTPVEALYYIADCVQKHGIENLPSVERHAAIGLVEHGYITYMGTVLKEPKKYDEKT